MITLASILLGLVVGYMRGGRLRGLAHIRLYRLPILLGALLLQMLIFPWLLWPEPPITWGTGFLHVVSYLLTTGFLVYNRAVLWPVLPGMGLNLAAIVANGGYMPASVSALQNSGRVTEAQLLAESADGTLSNVTAMGEGTYLNVLGDWLYVPDSVPLSTAFSIGDLLLLLGIAWILQAAMARPRAER